MALEDLRQSPRPVVSVIMANYNGADFIAEAIASVIKQTLRNIELIFCDDGSSDSSVEIVSRFMTTDNRIRLLRNDRNRGPAYSRNQALQAARGAWIAIIDSDDFIHPTRLETLINHAARDHADIVADDLLIFDAAHTKPPSTLLTGQWAKAPFWMNTADYVRHNALYGRRPVFGYLKPIFRAELITTPSVTYNEALTIGEDYHFILALLRTGARFRVYPELLYFYRKHTRSISHRLRQGTLEALKAADAHLLSDRTVQDERLKTALKVRVRSLDMALAYGLVLDLLRRGKWIEALRVTVVHPDILPLLRQPIVARLERLRSHFQSPRRRNHGVQLCILSRQRITGPTNGSSVYLLDLAGAIAARGFRVHLLSPSPTTLGSWPYLTVAKELSVFESIRIRGTWRIGRHFVSRDPRRAFRALLAICDIALLKSGLTKRSYFKRAPYSIAQPLTRDDQLYIAQHAAPIADYLLADYCFLVDALPYALRPSAGTAVLMHDRISSRPQQFEALQSDRLETMLTEADECRLLSGADTIVSIQQDEADFVRQRLPAHRVVVAPMAARAVGAAQPGTAPVVLFIGSSAAPNIDGIRWFLDSCWNDIRNACPTAELWVSGTVSRFLGNPPPGVRFLGFVDDLDRLYRQASLVVSPLRIGSGLKIKMIEALSRGKAVIATTTTLQGVADQLSHAVVIANDDKEFSAAVVRLLGDEESRKQLGLRGLQQIEKSFSADACYGSFIERIVTSTTSPNSPVGPDRLAVLPAGELSPQP